MDFISYYSVQSHYRFVYSTTNIACYSQKNQSQTIKMVLFGGQKSSAYSYSLQAKTLFSESELGVNAELLV